MENRARARQIKILSLAKSGSDDRAAAPIINARAMTANFFSKAFQRARVQPGGMQFDVLDPRTRLRHRGIRRGIQRGRSQALHAASPSDAALAALIWLSIFQLVERDLVAEARGSMLVSISFPHISGVRSSRGRQALVFPQRASIESTCIPPSLRPRSLVRSLGLFHTYLFLH